MKFSTPAACEECGSTVFVAPERKFRQDMEGERLTCRDHSGGA